MHKFTQQLDRFALANWRQQILLLLIIGSTLCFFGYNYFVLPYKQQALRQRQFYLSILSKLQQPSAQNKIMQLKQKIQQNQQLLAQKNIPPIKNDDQLQYLSQLIEAYPLSIEKLSATSKQSKYIISLHTTGPFIPSQKFLHQVMTSSPLLLIKEMRWGKMGKSLSLKLSPTTIDYQANTSHGVMRNIFTPSSQKVNPLFPTTPVEQLHYIGYNQQQGKSLALVRDHNKSERVINGNLIGLAHWQVRSINKNQIILTHQNNTYYLKS